MPQSQRSAHLNPAPKISFCIATRNRADLLQETLKSILSQATADIEIVIMDGASSDNTEQVIPKYQQSLAHVRYIRKNENGGSDRDYCAAADCALGDYCWFMSDDDVIKDGAIKTVLRHIERGYDLIIVNAENRTADLSRVLVAR